MSTDRPTPDQCEVIFHEMIRRGDARGVEAALTVMAPQDPHRAERLLGDLRTALALAAAMIRWSDDDR